MKPHGTRPQRTGVQDAGARRGAFALVARAVVSPGARPGLVESLDRHAPHTYK